MNSTNVPSNKKNDQKVNNPAPVCGQTIPKENGLEMPPKAASWGISVNEASNGEIEIPAGNSRINETNTLEMDNGTILDMQNPKAYQNVVSAKTRRIEMDKKVKQKEDGITITAIDPKAVEALAEFAKQKGKNNQKAQAGVDR